MPYQRRYLGLTAAVLALLLALPCHAAGNGKEVVVRELHSLSAASSTKITVLPLDDAHNPFRDRYEPWDRWVLAHAVECDDRQLEVYHQRALLPDETYLEAFVDAAGYLVPQRLAEERRLHALAAGDDPRVFDAAWTYRLLATGKIEPGVLANYRLALLQVRAEYCPAVPQWLAQQPAPWALVLPAEAGKHAGEVITFGAPGEDPDYALPAGEIRPGGRGKIWRRYSPTGQLLATSKPDQEWWEFYCANPATAEDGSFLRVFEADGYISVTDLHSGRRSWLMNFDGTRISDEQHAAPRDENHWQGFTAAEARAIFALQHGERPAQPAAARPKPPTHVVPLGGQH
jgi:hypothetical protein